MPAPTLILVMGVSGCGKTTVGRKLAARLSPPWTFLDADDFHPPANIAKMSAGIPLDDADRAPWLAALRARLDQAAREDARIVLACSALKARYRTTLIADPPRTMIVWLHAPRELLARWLARRAGHFMKPAMLDSQLDALEQPQPHEAATMLPLDAAQSFETLATRITTAIAR